MSSPASAQVPEQAENTRSFIQNRSNLKRRVAFVGTGNIADWHAQCIASVRDVELVAVCDLVIGKAQTFAKKFGIAKTYSSLETMLAEESLDAVHVLLPPDRHFEAARTVLHAGVNVFLEKPMCDRAADCESLVRIASERGLRVGVDHNYLFSDPYQKLRRDVRDGVLGQIDHVTITWNRPLPPVSRGPFNIWMLRDPRNILLEIGSHTVAAMVDLIGVPEELHVHASNPTEMPNLRRFYRRWQVNAFKANTAIELRFSFVPAYAEYTIHVRGSLAAATVDYEGNTYVLQQHSMNGPDLDKYGIVLGQVKQLKKQARHTLLNALRSKYTSFGARGHLFGMGLARAMDAFYGPNGPLDDRVDALTGAKVIRLCEEMGALANLPPEAPAITPTPMRTETAAAPKILLLGGMGFIGKEVVRQLVDAGHSVRMLARNPGNLPQDLRVPQVECQPGDLMNKQDLRKAMDGIDYVIDVARAYVQSWADYQEFEIGATKLVAECALEAGIKRLVYSGSIASYYQGRHAGTITEATPPDPLMASLNLYAKAKNVSEAMLLKMHREQGLPVVILRPGVVIGRGGSPFHVGVGMWRYDAVCQTWGKGTNKLPLVLVEDVASALIAAMDKPGIEAKSFNLVGDPCLSAHEYLDELNRCGGIKVQRYSASIFKLYLADLMKSLVKLGLRHPEGRLPSYKAWESRTLCAPFDCSAAKSLLGWQPVTDRKELVRRGIEEPMLEFMK
jgi:predicted dehydrogenase/nucleoside-diphosphate-sugar epimerase